MSGAGLVWVEWRIMLCHVGVGWVEQNLIWLDRMELYLDGAELSWLALNLVELSQVVLC